jgi:hypothetical protein
MLDVGVGKACGVRVLTAQVHSLGEPRIEFLVDLRDPRQHLAREPLRSDGDQVEVAHARKVVARG